MRSLAKISPTPIELASWPLAAAQTLDERHLVAWSDSRVERDRFASDLSAMLWKIDDTQVCELDGSGVRDLGSFCIELARALGVGAIEASFDSREGVCNALRAYPKAEAGHCVKRRYIFWHEAQHMLRADAKLFGRMVDALVGVAAEGEFIQEDVLLLQRTVFIGSAAMDVYSEDPRGQMRSWFAERGEDPVWGAITGESGPRVTSWHIGSVLEAG